MRERRSGADRADAAPLGTADRRGAGATRRARAGLQPLAGDSGERTHCWVGAEDALGLRVRRFNLGLLELSTRHDFSIVDVERIAACAGAERLKIDMVHLTPEGLRLVAEEVVRILEDRGCFDVPEA